jgi:hypothetical protein
MITMATRFTQSKWILHYIGGVLCSVDPRESLSPYRLHHRFSTFLSFVYFSRKKENGIEEI